MTPAKARTVTLGLAALLTGTVVQPRPARADLFGGDVVVLAGILAESIQQGITIYNQLSRLKEQVENGKETLKRLENISGFRDGLHFYDTVRFDYESMTKDVQAISFNALQVKADFDRLFPKNQNAWRGVSDTQLQSRSAAWNEELTSSAVVANRVQTQMMNAQVLNDRARHALSMSETEGGVVRQLQAMNQMLSVMQNQMNTLVQVLATGNRVTSNMAASTAGKDMMIQEGKRRRLEGYANPGPPPRKLSRLPRPGR